MSEKVVLNNRVTYWHGMDAANPYLACAELLHMMRDTFVAAEESGVVMDFSTLSITGEPSNMAHSTDFALRVQGTNV